MLSQGPNDPGTLVSLAASGLFYSWTSASNAQTQNDTYASCTSGARSDSITYYLACTNFGFTLPSAAIISGIVVEIDRRASQVNMVRDYRLRIIRGDGSVGTTDKAKTSTYWPVLDADTYESYGADNDLWGETWNFWAINSPYFGVGLSAYITGGGFTAYVDHIRMTVYYTANGIITKSNKIIKIASNNHFVKYKI